MACCERCFSDLWLKQYFRDNSVERGDCPYCGSRGARSLPLSALAPHFGAVLGLYRELTPDTILDDEDPLVVGDLLETLVEDDWGILSSRILNLEEIGGDPDDPENPARLAEALGEELANLARSIRRGRAFYRGRPGVDANGAPFSGDAIGAPPPGMGGAGRANPVGVSMLYVAREEATATAELRVRQPQGHYLCPVSALHVI